MKITFDFTKTLALTALFMTVVFVNGCHKKDKFAEPDLTPPTLSNITASSVTDSTITITWSTDESALVTVEYGTTTSYGLSEVSTATGMSGSFGLTGLTPDTTYHYRIKAVDDSGNVTYSADDSFTTNGPLATIQVTPTTVDMVTEEVRLFTATGKDAHGKAAAVVPNWSVTNGIGTLSASMGLTVALTAADANAATSGTITATYGGITGSATVNITGGFFPAPPEDGAIYKIITPNASSEILAEYYMGVNTLEGETSWLNDNDPTWTASHDYMKLAYPGSSSWGAAFILVKPVEDFAHYTSRNAYNFSAFTKIHLQLKGAAGGETVKIGVKDFNDPDDGLEKKYTIDTITNNWQTFEIPLSEFPSGDRSNLKKLYVVLEFVWDSTGMDPQKKETIYVKDIQYIH